MAYAGVVGLSKPANYEDWTAYATALHTSLQAWGRASGIHMDECDDATDDARLTTSIAYQQAATDRNMPPIVYPCRPMSVTTPRQLYSGHKGIGLVDGQKNPDIAGGSRSGPEFNLGGSIGVGTSSFWRSPSVDVNDVTMANFQVQGSQGSGAHQFLDYAGGGSLYPGSFHSLSFNFLNGVFGSATRKALMTQVTFTGDWTINNCWNTPLNPGGSDVNIAPSMMNIGVSQSGSQGGGLTTYFLRLDTTEATVSGKIYISTMNGWRGVLLSGAGSTDWRGGVIEGYKRDVVNATTGPGPGSQIKITGGSHVFTGVKVGQGMNAPDGSEGGLIDMSGGVARFFGPTFYGANSGSVNAIRQSGGRLWVYGAGSRIGDGVPRLASNATIYNGKLTVAVVGPPAYAIGDTAPDSMMYDEGTSFCWMDDYSMRKVA